jgi:UDP-N-acetylmuramoyl-L-alanyl-D-glutamate--2,6-diaminopimelate ligase
MQEYGKAKQALFNSEKSAREMHTAVICNDTPWGDFMVQPFKGRVIRYGRQNSSDIRLIHEELDVNGSRFEFKFLDKTYKAHTTLVGSYNIDNCLAAIGALISLGINIEKALEFLPLIHGVRGRLERVNTPWGYTYVDYSHKPDALEHILTTLKKVYKDKKLICVFGCGGDRDRGKRPMMGEIAARLSDRIWITSDNPRSEDPQAIIQEILSGIPSHSSTEKHVNIDRQKAIYEALGSMSSQEVLVVAGKGHETYQTLGSRVIPFDDVEVIKNWPGFQSKKETPL